MIDEDHQEREAAQEIDTEVAVAHFLSACFGPPNPHGTDGTA
jgi:hypothetical protein